MIDLASRLAIPLLALAFAAVFEYSIAGLRFESRALPQILIVLLAAASLYCLGREIIDWRLLRASSDKAAVTAIPTRSLVRACVVIVATALFVLALPHTGFHIATGAFVATVYGAFGNISWRVLPFVASVVGAFYVLFELILTVQLPGSF